MFYWLCVGVQIIAAYGKLYTILQQNRYTLADPQIISCSNLEKGTYKIKAYKSRQVF